MTTRDQRNPTVARIEGLLTEHRDLFKDLLREALQDVLEGEMAELLGAASGERSRERQGYRAGHYRPQPGNPGWETRAAGAAGPGWQFLDRPVGALPAVGEGLG